MAIGQRAEAPRLGRSSAARDGASSTPTSAGDAKAGASTDLRDAGSLARMLAVADEPTRARLLFTLQRSGGNRQVARMLARARAREEPASGTVQLEAERAAGRVARKIRPSGSRSLMRDEGKSFTAPKIPKLAGNTALSTLVTWGGRSVEVDFFPGTSNETVLILGGVHQDERKAIELSNQLLKRLQSAKAKPFYNVVFIPNLFGGRNTTDQEIDKTPTNRNSPGQNESLVDAAKRGKGTPRDVEGRKILPENVILFALVEAVKPKASLSIHSHSVVNDPKQVETKGAASITVDPKPGGEQEADFFAKEMAVAANEAGVPVPGNQVKDGKARTRYPTETAAHKPGVTFGQWGSHQGGMDQYLIETEGKGWPGKPSASQQAEISGWTQVIESKFLADPQDVAFTAFDRDVLEPLWKATQRVLLGK